MHNFLQFWDKTLGSMALFYSLCTILSRHRHSFVKLYGKARKVVGNKKGKEQRYIIFISSMVLFFIFQLFFLSFFLSL